MSFSFKSISPKKEKISSKNLNLKLEFTSPISDKLPKLESRRRIRLKSQEITNTLRSKTKTEEEKEQEEIMKTKLFRQSDPLDICINALKILPSNRSEQEIKIISYYLESLKNFMNIFNEQIEKEELNEFLYSISSELNYENVKINNFIFKYSDKAEKFYIILKGKVEFCVPKENKIYMNEYEYLLFLIKLRFNNEQELIKKTLENNKISFNYGDNFDQFVIKSLYKHEKEKENLYSEEIYLYFKKIRELFIEKKNINYNNNENGENIDKNITVDDYLKRTSFDQINSLNNQPEKKRILLNIFQYERTNIFEDGDCFGLSSSKKKSHKRSATAISIENCDLAVLDKNLYDQMLDKISKKAKEKLYKLVISHKIFNKISKITFNNKYCHMFRFSHFSFNNEIMDDSTPFDKIIIFTSGEFVLSVNKNIFELNNLIIKLKKIAGSFFNLPEKIINNYLNEIEENENLENTKKYASHSVYEYITKKQNLVITTLNDKMILGYPDTVDHNGFMPFFNCKCISNSATGYVIERDMIKLFKRDGYLRTTPPKIAIQKIEFYMKRLLEHKKNIMNRIEFLEEQDKKYGLKNYKKIPNSSDNKRNNNVENNNDINNNKSEINKNNNKNIKIFQANEEKNDDDFNITRNNLNPLNLKNNNEFEFQSKKIVSLINPSYLYQIPKTKEKQIHIIEQKKVKENYLNLKKLEKQINKKKFLLNIAQHKSRRFTQNEKTEIKKYQIYSNKYNVGGYYNDISNIFSKKPDKKISILDKYRKKTEDNVLDPKIDTLKRELNNERYNLVLPRTNKTINNTEINSSINTINNINNINNTSIDIRNKFIIPPQSQIINNTSIKKNFKNLKNINIERNSAIKKIKINYNDLSLDTDKVNEESNNINKLNKTKFRNLYDKLFTDYIHDQINQRKNNDNTINIIDNSNQKEKQKNFRTVNNNYQKMDNYKLNKLQLNKIKNKNFSQEHAINNKNNEKKGISIVDPLAFGYLAEKY